MHIVNCQIYTGCCDKIYTNIPDFKTHINNFHDRIKFTFDCSSNQVPFLDVMVYLDDHTITTNLFSKPTDAHDYLYPTSCHHPHIFRSIVYSQALRIKRICSKDSDCNEQLETLKSHFLYK